MKLHGQTPSLATSILVLPRPDGGLVFKFQAVQTFQEFHDLVPQPKPPVRVLAKSNTRVADFEDKTFLQEVAKYERLHSYWLTIKSLEPTEGLEWEIVKRGDPESWLRFEEELLAANLTKTEINRIVSEAMRVNSLDDAMLEEARKSFLAGQAAQERQSNSLTADQQNTQSGEPAKD